MDLNPAVPPKDNANVWAMFCHVGVFLALVIPFANYVVPLVIWLIKKQEFPLVDAHGKESLNFQIAFTIYGIGLLITTALLAVPIIFVAKSGRVDLPLLIAAAVPPVLGLLTLLALFVGGLVLPVIAGMKAYERAEYRYPLIFRWVR